jgi:uncharacterized OB-fold protein
VEESVEMNGWVCSKCGAPINEPDKLPRDPCPQCGATARTANVSVREEAHVEAYVKVHSKHRDGGPKVVREVVSGDVYFRKGRRWTVIYRLIDRANNWYEEKFFERQTMKVIRETSEPLTEHRGHGSDTKNKP